MMHHSRAASTLALLLLVACGNDGGGPHASGGAAPPDSAAASAVPGTIAIEHRAERDLTGDARPERLSLRATGPRFDSLDVRLEIRSPEGELLHLDRWASRHYFEYGWPEDSSAAGIERVVRAHLRRVLADSAFVPMTWQGPGGVRQTLDSTAVADHVIEWMWRDSVGLPDTAPIPQGADVWSSGRLKDPEVRRRAAALAAELPGRPRFTYYAGGEVTYSIAWSPTERRFVRVFSCC